ncbi:MAG: DUF4140 domain-containing protein, partial [Proteobacteria bacterium]|nr:DUF4140 domain-containing protein [Pseudomonadota bacterium]
MRLCLWLPCLIAIPLHAETIEAPARVTQVTIFPSGAAVVRHVALTLPAGTHQLLIASLPKDTDPGALRVVAS